MRALVFGPGFSGRGEAAMTASRSTLILGALVGYAAATHGADGWYLMQARSLAASNKPIGTWSREMTFDTAAACEQTRRAQHQRASHILDELFEPILLRRNRGEAPKDGEPDYELWKAAVARHMPEILARCIAASDPVLR
jgi:hypothetical protein